MYVFTIALEKYEQIPSSLDMIIFLRYKNILLWIIPVFICDSGVGRYDRLQVVAAIFTLSHAEQRAECITHMRACMHRDGQIGGGG